MRIVGRNGAMITPPMSQMGTVFFFYLRRNCLLNTITAAHGKSALPNLAKENRKGYHELLAEDKQNLVEEFRDFRVSKAVGICVKTKSKISDVTHTLAAIENEVYFLLGSSLLFVTTTFLASESQCSYWRQNFVICNTWDD